MTNNNSLDDFLEIYNNISMNELKTLPLCAAENISSDFVKIPHSTFLQEKYVLGGIMKYLDTNNFHGSDKLFDIYIELQNECGKLFKCNYADARTLSGLNAITTLLMALYNIGDTILITSPEYGGHSSMKIICERLGLKAEFLPYDYDAKDFDYLAINSLISKYNVDGILIALSDMIEHPQLHKINIKNTTLIYDATQILGLIATNNIENPFNWFSDEDNFILMGATHKTIPGPTCGLIMTRNIKLAEKIDLKINPNYLRNVQLNNVTSLLFSLYELDDFGKEYFDVMRSFMDTVAIKLENNKVKLIKTRDGHFSNTHQLWLSLPEKTIDIFERNSLMSDVSLNIRRRKIYDSQGVRLGFQQIARFNWGNDEAETIAEILILLMKSKCNFKQISEKIKKLPPKEIHFTYDKAITDNVKQVLHNSNIH